MKKQNKKAILISIIAAVAICFFAHNKYQQYVYTPVDKDNDSKVSFQIKKGETSKEIGQKLEEKDLIKSATAFYLYAKLNNLGENILAGRFVLNQGMNVPEIIQAISDPTQAEFVITIQEGLRIRDIDEKLVDLNLTKKGDFINAAKNFNGWQYYSFLDKDTLSKLEIPLEGYIYPDTYFLDPENFNSDELIYKALDNFEQKFTPLQEKIKNHSYNEILTMASIIENEVFGEKDKKIVSGILWKRLESNWPIGADASILYITEDRSISRADLNIESPYNTRKNLGLPPGPISNPSVESIEAAMYPETSEYWFYLTTLDTGKVIYSKSNEEQNINRAKYL